MESWRCWGRDCEWANHHHHHRRNREKDIIHINMIHGACKGNRHTRNFQNWGAEPRQLTSPFLSHACVRACVRARCPTKVGRGEGRGVPFSIKRLQKSNPIVLRYSTSSCHVSLSSAQSPDDDRREKSGFRLLPLCLKRSPSAQLRAILLKMASGSI